MTSVTYLPFILAWCAVTSNHSETARVKRCCGIKKNSFFYHAVLDNLANILFPAVLFNRPSSEHFIHTRSHTWRHSRTGGGTEGRARTKADL